MSNLKKQTGKHEFGQSLVELALILPIILIILAGTIEVSNILLTKNRVETAARSAARYASNGGDDVYIVALNTVTQTLDLSDGLWDIWTIEATTNAGGTGFDTGDWVVNHVYGISNTTSYTEVANRISVNCLTDCISTRLIQDLQKNAQNTNNTGLAADLEVVGVFITHDIGSILGLSVLPAYQNFTSVQGLGVMQAASQSIVDTTEGCDVVFPFGVSKGIRSIEEATYNNIKTQMTYPTTPPSYYSFSYHNPNVPMADATDGDIFRFSFEQVEIGWLRWNQYLQPTSANLAKSLAWPGNSSSYVNCTASGCTGSAVSPYPHPVWGFAEPGDVDNKSMHINNRVAANLGASISGVTTQLQNHISNNRALRIPIFEETFAVQYLADGTPYYEIREFGVFRIRGYSTSNNWILLEFVRKDTSCGN
jgi:Flp pilus assembly protein TadG